MTNGMFKGTVGAGGVTWETTGEAGGVMVDGAGDWDGPTEVAWGPVSEAAGLRSVDEAMGVAVSVLDDEEAGRDCESVSGPAGGAVSGRAGVLSRPEILMDKTNCLIDNYYQCANIQTESWPKTTTKTHL